MATYTVERFLQRIERGDASFDEQQALAELVERMQRETGDYSNYGIDREVILAHRGQASKENVKDIITGLRKLMGDNQFDTRDSEIYL